MRCYFWERSNDRIEKYNFNIRGYFGDSIDDDELCFSWKMRCYVWDKRKSRLDIYKLDEDFEFEFLCYDNEIKLFSENISV